MEDAALLLLEGPLNCLQTRELMVQNTCPQNQIQKRSHPWQGWKSLGVQGNHIHMHDQLFTHQSSFCIQCVGEDDERILNHVFFLFGGVPV